VTDARMADHWWWRPGWQPGRRMYTWHFTFDDQQAVHDLAAAYQARLAALPGLDLIPSRWLHLTTQGVGFTDEVSDDEVTALTSASTERLKGFAAQRVMLGPARVTPEAILLDVAPDAGLAGIRHQLREAIRDVLGAGRLMEGESWTPHVSVAYSNSTGPQDPYVAALDGGLTAETVIGTVELIVLGRDNQLYEWTTRSVVPLPGNGAGASEGALR
jgi:2'-5' RNA ligase superfamily